MEGSKEVMDQNDTGYKHSDVESGEKLLLIVTLLIIVASVIIILIIMNKVPEKILFRSMGSFAFVDSALISMVVIRKSRAVKAQRSLNKIYLVNTPDPGSCRIFINKKIFKIGRLPELVDFCIKDSTVSKLHAKIIKVRSKYYIIDMNSTNGTYINGVRLKRNKKSKILNGDMLLLGKSRFIFIKEV